MRPNSVVLSLALTVAAHGVWAAEVVNIDWGKSQRFEMQRSIAPGQVLELCGPLSKGQGVDWQFVADHPLAFNIHHHIGKQIQYAERRTRTKSLTSRFVPEQATDYCWMWTAPAQQAVRVQVLLRY
jgi:hypothetical protein